MSMNPFSSGERQHFPEFSPMFRQTQSNTEGSNTFRWSIDNIARLKPAEIATDAANLVQTNGHSPDNDCEAQVAVDTFFSQKTILPSPWPVTRHLPKKTLKPSTPEDSRPAHTKKVTFSPLPPATAFIRNDSLVESDIRDSKTVDAGTQTMLTFPMNFDLEKLILEVSMETRVPPTLPESPEEVDGRDSANLSLRRKLFGQPDRQESSSLSPSPTMGSDTIPLSALSPLTFDPTEVTCPPQFLQSPPLIYVTKGTDGGSKEEHNPAFSSLVLNSPMKDVPDLSPIGDQTKSSGDEGSSAARPMPELSPIKPDCQTTVPTSGVFPATPRSKSGVPASSNNHCTAISPIENRPLTCKRTPVLESDRASTCTSTPNSAVTKRQLLASPFASPVLKHPCTMRVDIDSNPLTNDINEDIHQDISSNSPIRIENSGQELPDHDSLDEMAEPLSLDDLRTETLELTNITASSCTGYFTNLDLDDGGHVAMEIRGHAHQSMKGGVSSAQEWPPHHPKAHSTMVDSQLRPHSHAHTDLSGPYVRGLSHIPVSSQTSLTGLDSGVVGSIELNPSSMSMSNGEGGSKRPQSEDPSHPSQDGRQEEVVCGERKRSDSIGDLKTPVPSRQLSVIREGVSGRGEMVDSGLVFSPDPPTQFRHEEATGGVVTTHKPHPHFAINQKHTQQSVLPSRLQLRTTAPSLLPPTNPAPGHYLLQSPYRSTPRMTSPVTKYSNTPRVTSPVSQILHKTPPSRFRCVGGSHVSAHEVFPDDVLKKKKALKAKLQFSGSSGYHRDVLRTLNNPSCMQPRILTGSAVPTRPRSPLAGVTNKTYTPFSHTVFSPAHSVLPGGVSLATPTSPLKSPWQQSSPLHKENVEVGWRTYASSGYS